MFNNLLSGHSNPFAGIRIIESDACLEETEVPRRKHTRKAWMRDSYHKRIQKKWTKRFGCEMRPVMFQTAQGIICHPAIAQHLRAQISAR